MDGINKMQTDQLSSQLATLKIITMSNIFSELGQKTSNKTTKFYNGIRKCFGASPVKETKVVPIEKRIADCKLELDKKSRETLLADTRGALIEKIKSLGILLNNDVSDDALSIYVIEAACENFKKDINRNLSPSQKADAVYQRYNERLVSQMQEKYKKASDKEKEEINEQLQKEADAMSEEQKEELKKALKVDEITGETLSKLLSTTAGASAMLMALNASGFGVFMALTTIIHAVFTTVFGITVPFAVYTSLTKALAIFLGPIGWIGLAGVDVIMWNKNKKKLIYELMSQVVWGSVLECGGRFTPKDESLPSWLPEEQRKEAVADNEKFMELQNRFDSLQEKYNMQNCEILEKDKLQNTRELEIAGLKEKIVAQKMKVEEFEKLRMQMEVDSASAKAEFDKYKQYADSENEGLRQKYADADRKYKNAEKNIQGKQKEIDKLIKSNKESEELIGLYVDEIDQISVEKAELEKINSEMKISIDEMKGKVEREEKKESKKLQERWEAAFKRFEFDNGVIKSVTKKYQYNEYGHIERRLMELHEAKDPAALSANRGKMEVTGELHLEVSTPTGFPSRIFYIPLKNAGSGKMVRITKICKHNDSRYGK